MICLTVSRLLRFAPNGRLKLKNRIMRIQGVGTEGFRPLSHWFGNTPSSRTSSRRLPEWEPASRHLRQMNQPNPLRGQLALRPALDQGQAAIRREYRVPLAEVESATPSP